MNNTLGHILDNKSLLSVFFSRPLILLYVRAELWVQLCLYVCTAKEIFVCMAAVISTEFRPKMCCIMTIT